jgi:hypothetical protein
MFLDTEEKRLLVGGNGVSVHYASAVNVQERPDGSYWLDKQDLNKEEEIKPDDLIINSDGRFFRVFSLSVDNHTIICSLLAVSGTGSGGGPGGDGPAANEKDIDVIWHNLKYSFVAGTPYYMTFTANSKVD